MSELSETPVAAAAEAEELDFEEGESAVAGEAGQESSPGKAKATAAPPATEGAEVTEAGTEQEVAAWEADLEEEEGAQEEEEEPIVWEAGEEITPIAELGIPLSDEEGSEAATAEENDAKVAPADGEGIPEAEQDGKEGEDAAATQTVSFVDTREKQVSWSRLTPSFHRRSQHRLLCSAPGIWLGFVLQAPCSPDPGRCSRGRSGASSGTASRRWTLTSGTT